MILARRKCMVKGRRYLFEDVRRDENKNLFGIVYSIPIDNCLSDLDLNPIQFEREWLESWQSLPHYYYLARYSRRINPRNQNVNLLLA